MFRRMRRLSQRVRRRREAA
ncbi:unnamed protein product [Linum tenue]|uniref:Uncharacterized protein n=2 Tax=Linum tenue TaxID=586396 RepID=A0AAV0RN88_9ROSI|nr:unnamed protein product [Linum tenue]